MGKGVRRERGEAGSREEEGGGTEQDRMREGADRGRGEQGGQYRVVQAERCQAQDMALGIAPLDQGDDINKGQSRVKNHQALGAGTEVLTLKPH